jgi:hypothetical protein
VLTADAFATLLQWLIEVRKKHEQPSALNAETSAGISDEEMAGEEYERIRETLISFFARKGCVVCAELADETINRVATRIKADENIVRTEPIPARFFFNTARYIFLESLKAKDAGQTTIDELPPSRHPSIDPKVATQREAERLEREHRIDCLEKCKVKLRPDNWEMIIEYYQGETKRKIENRKLLAEKLKLTPNALNIRAHRVRKQLEDCLSACFNGAVESPA